MREVHSHIEWVVIVSLIIMRLNFMCNGNFICRQFMKVRRGITHKLITRHLLFYYLYFSLREDFLLL